MIEPGNTAFFRDVQRRNAPFPIWVTDSGILVKIGDKNITTEEFLSTYSKNNNLSTATEADLRDYLDLFINFKMKVMEGEAMQMDTSRQFKMELQSYKKQSSQQYLVDKEVTEALINEATNRAKVNVRASHILINCPEKAVGKDTAAAYNKAISLRNDILAGKLTFAEAAVSHSDDPSARDMVNPQNGRLHYGNKGDLGYVTGFDLIYPFEYQSWGNLHAGAHPFRLPSHLCNRPH